MDESKADLGPILLRVLAITIMVCFAVAFFGVAPLTTVAHADPLPTCSASSGFPCVIGNVEMVGVSGQLFMGGNGFGCGGMGTGTGETLSAVTSDPLNPGFMLTPKNGTCMQTGPASASASGTIEFKGLNGFLIDDLSFSVPCSVTGAASFSFTFGTTLTGVNPLMSSCPTGVTVVGTGDITFTPVSTVYETLSLTGTAPGAGDSWTFGVFSNNISLVPEPGTLSLLLGGLLGLAGRGLKKLMA